MTWELENNGVRQSLAQWGIETPKLTLQNRAPDELTFSIPKEGDPAIHFPTRLVRFYKLGQCVFSGRLDQWGDQVSGESESIRYKASGPWWYLDHLIYRQTYPTRQGDLPLSEVILGTGPDGFPTTVAAALADILEFAEREGTPIAPDFSQPAFDSQAPLSSGSDMTCAQAIDRLLEYTPGAVAAWDYSIPRPRLHIAPQQNLPVREIAIGTAGLSSYNLAPSGDRPTGIDIHYILPSVDLTETTSTIDRVIETESFPPQSETSPFRRLQTTVDLTEDPDSPRPSGLAQRYYESIPPRSFRGSITLVDEEVSGPWMGRAIRLTGGRADYAAATLPVQSANHDIETGTVTLDVGAPDHIAPDTWIEQQRALTAAFRR